jgi:glutamyl-tRNA reductase
MTPPLAVVGVSWRSTSTLLRGQLARLADEPGLLEALHASGYVTGSACVSTCSRTEWILTGDQPAWAGNLLRSALMARCPDATPEQIQVRAGVAAVSYVCRVAVGLDSVAEGENAVGRQLLKAFEKARRGGFSDGRLHRVWRHLERLIHQRREQVPAAPSVGVQSLVRRALLDWAPKTVAILGRGDFGQAVERSLLKETSWEVSTWSRQTMPELMDHLDHLDALVVCTGGAQPWLELPQRVRPGLCMDVGSPPQVVSAPGWEMLGLDVLLQRSEFQLLERERALLEHLVEERGTSLVAELTAPAPTSALKAIDAERSAFLNHQLPALLVGLSPKEARRVRQAVGAFTHRLLRKTREAHV